MLGCKICFVDMMRAGLIAIPVLLGALSADAGIIVQQVEAFENQPTDTHYAPIDFGGATTATDPGYAGITFHAQGSTTDTLSAHAHDVSARFYGPATVAAPYVSDVYSNTADNFTNDLNTQPTLDIAQVLPNGFGNGIKVSNHSYVGDFGDNTTDENAIRRIDYIVNAEDVVMVAGAVTDTSGVFANQNIVWTSRNALSVRGNNSGTPFNVSLTGPGKRRADLWQDEFASYATGRVSGYATALIGQAQSAGQTDATHNQVVRSLLMTGADKISANGSGGTIAYDPTLPNHLSVTSGAGKANYAASLALLQSGERTAQTVSGGAVTGPATAAPLGWTYGTVAANGRSVVLLQVPAGQSISTLTATLNWNVTQQSDALTIDTSNAGQIFANLDLELRPVTLVGGQYLIGSQFADPNLNSDSTNDNAESLYFNGTTTLPAGYYALDVLNNDPANATPFGLSYNLATTALTPEPTSGAILLCVAVAAFGRRRRLGTR